MQCNAGAWLRQHIEQIPPPLPADEKKVILKRLLQADGYGGVCYVLTLFRKYIKGSIKKMCV
jgi:hypothetical protein